MKILVAVDGSKPAIRAVKHAAKLVGLMRLKAPPLTLISVHDDAGLRHAKALVGNKEVASYLRERSEEELKPVRKWLDAAGVKYQVEIRTGHVAQEIVHFAEKGKFDLIVLGSKGRGAVADLLLGSVAQRVLAGASQPVVLVK